MDNNWDAAGRRDSDLGAVRDLRAGLGEPDNLSLVRVRHRILHGIETGARPPGRAQARWAVAGSALAAAGIAIGLIVVIGGRPGAPAGAVGDPSTGVSTSSGAQATPTPTSTAARMATTPVRLTTGELLYVRQDFPGLKYEAWIDVNGVVSMAIKRTDDGVLTVDNDEKDMASHIAEVRTDLAQHGPNLTRPTPAYLDGLPTTREAMLALITDQLGRNGAGAARPELIFKNTSGLLSRTEPLWSPATRAAVLEALASLPGAKADHTPLVFAGRPAYIVQQTRSTNIEGVYVDSETGRILGEFAGVTSMSPSSTGTQWTFGIATHPGTP